MLFIILLLIILFIGWVYMRVKPGVEERNRVRAITELNATENTGASDKASYPSWFDSNHRVDKFLSMVVADTGRKEIPERFVEEILTNENELKKMMFLVATVEKSGSSFKEQATFISDRIDAAWCEVNFSEYHKYIDEKV